MWWLIVSLSAGVFSGMTVYLVITREVLYPVVKQRIQQIGRSLTHKRSVIGNTESRIERHLPELAETVALGMRAGLSFNRSFELYCERFDDELSDVCTRAYKQWQGGFVTREEALSHMANESGSELLRRLVVNINRSLRLGGSLARTLEVLSSEARSCHKAKIEERIARVPVKMMIPTAVCILPSMLIVVLGPVVLAMMK